MKKYKNFDDWFWERESFSTRGERFYEELASRSINERKGYEWLKAAWECALAEKEEEPREQIGWIEREEGFYALYAPVRGSIVTQAFIHCKDCNGSIYHCMGPKYDAICMKCKDERDGR